MKAQRAFEHMRKYQGDLIHSSRGAAGVIEVVQERDTRSLHFGDATRQSTMYLHHPAVLVLPYTQYMLSALLYRDAPARVLLVGLGGGSLVRFLLHYYPQCRIDAVEPHAAVVQVARRFFALPRDERLQIHLADGMELALGAPASLGGYHLILVDAYDAGGPVSWVARREFYAALAPRLAADGVLAVNLARTRRAGYKGALRALRRCFPRRVLRLPVAGRGNEIALARSRQAPAPTLLELQERAAELQSRLGLDFPHFVQALRRDDAPGLSWLAG